MAYHRSVRRLAVAVAILLASPTARAEDLAAPLAPPPEEGAELGFGVGVHVVAPRTSLAGGGNLAPESAMPFLARVGYRFATYFSIEAEAEVAQGSSRSADGTGVLFGYRGLVTARTAGMDSRFRPFVALGGGGFTAHLARPSASSITDTVGHVLVGGGLEIGLGAAIGLRLDARALVGPGGAGHTVAVDAEVLIGICWSADGTCGFVERGMIESPEQLRETLPERDSDGDGIPNHLDRCPITPEDLDGIDDEDGCPDLDDDHDEIYEPIDRCPNEPEDFDGVDDDDGCPDPDTDTEGGAARAALD